MTSLNYQSFKTQIFPAFSQTFALYSFKTEEDSVKQGGNWYTSSLFQSVEIHYALKMVARYFDAAKRPFPFTHFYARMAIYLSPMVLAWTLNIEDLSPTIRESLLFTHNHMGHLCQIATMTSTALLFRLGQPLFAVTAMTNLIMMQLMHKPVVPHFIRKHSLVWNHVSKLINIKPRIKYIHTKQPLYKSTIKYSFGFFVPDIARPIIPVSSPALMIRSFERNTHTPFVCIHL